MFQPEVDYMYVTERDGITHIEYTNYKTIVSTYILLLLPFIFLHEILRSTVPWDIRLRKWFTTLRYIPNMRSIQHLLQLCLLYWTYHEGFPKYKKIPGRIEIYKIILLYANEVILISSI